ncbi:hypothetical protein IFY68_05512 (plasmid) [Klebsiella pneumoniae]|uniref:hypothetical protein n=1 Tax=Klebsiella pneumoniae TaxID=573 RepID=UPI000E2B38A4|nr:hypothetical protein [Klebsiella pneumoniae]QRC83469.1 hypothetical protein IFY68_05512 [Klebsiella pneumoniae]SYF74550.1 putative plasmid-like protein [Klebsiella pneumoniae]
MTDKEIKHRMSTIQRSILISLYLLERKLEGPIEVRDLRRILNKDRCERGVPELHASNFSVSCKVLNQRGFLYKFRDKVTLCVAYKLTEKGVVEGEKEYTKLLKELE